MIIFDLACQHEHRFEGWFQSRADFDEQSSRGLISCPDCGSPQVRRVPSALHLGSQPRTASPAVTVAASPEAAVDRRGGPLSTYRQLTTMLLASCEDVGDRFAEEARRIHYLEAPARSIRGEASAEDYEALRDEGVEVLRLPRLKAGDLH